MSNSSCADEHAARVAAEMERDRYRAAIEELRLGLRTPDVWRNLRGALSGPCSDGTFSHPLPNAVVRRVAAALLPVVNDVLQRHLTPEAIATITLECRQLHNLRGQLLAEQRARQTAEAERDRLRAAILPGQRTTATWVMPSGILVGGQSLTDGADAG